MATAGEGAAEHLDDRSAATRAEPVCRGIPHDGKRNGVFVDGADERREEEHLFAVVETAERNTGKVEVVAMMHNKAGFVVLPDCHREASNLRGVRLPEIVQHRKFHSLACVGADGDEGCEMGKACVCGGGDFAAKAAAHAVCIRRDEPHLLKLFAYILYGVVLRQVAHCIGEGDLGVVYAPTVEACSSGMVVAAHARKHLLLTG